ncbi:GGDEF domain-containing protein [Nocardia mangyaensis]|uniref:GGDEF domain-containing protein n=1 Tax=Nocardia mangyaensis TaxID=2213200 RepID=UPI0026772683|nr:GGDEF domain-containing protein [Nocardia mangyaensis]MDO3645620.1 GGDEF domain-containing protein [Nocardia mangyaensis]
MIIRGTRHGSARWWALVGGAAGAVLVSAILGARTLSLLLFVVIVAGSLAMIGIGLRRHRPAHRLPWHLLAGSMPLFAVGAALRETGLHQSWHPVDELSTLAAYLCLGSAAVSWLQPRRVVGARDLWLDSTLIGLSALLASWTFLISPILRHGSGFDTVLAASHPVIHALLLTVLAHSLATTAGSRTSLRLMQAALIAVLLGGLLESLTAAGTLVIGSEFALVPHQWAYLLAGLAALHPTMSTLPETGDVHPHRSRRRAGVIAVALVAASLVSVVGADLGSGDRVVICLLLTLLLVGVLVRSERAIARSVRSERRAQYQADHDLLTGLLNRAALLRAPHRYRGQWAGKPLCLLFIDLDGFKMVNDSYGHAVGDELIANAAARIRRTTGDTDVTARYGGDEFVVLGARTRAEAAVLAQHLLGAFVRPFDLSCGEIPITASIGIACVSSRPTETTIYDLLRAADAAMYHAKEYRLGLTFHDDLRKTRRHTIVHTTKHTSKAV